MTPGHLADVGELRTARHRLVASEEGLVQQSALVIGQLDTRRRDTRRLTYGSV